MVFTSAKKTMTVNLDWLSFSVLLKQQDPVLNCPQGYRLEQLSGNQVFKNRAILYKDGEKALTLLWCPYSKAIDPLIMTCQLANYWLYSGRFSGWFSVLQSVVDCTFNNFSRIDIAVDFAASDRQLAIIRRLGNNSCYMAAKDVDEVRRHNSSYKGVVTKMPYYLSWGATNTQFKWKTYNKAREQNTDHHLKAKRKDGSVYYVPPEKPYIVETWENANMDITRVWRIELSIGDVGQLRIDQAQGKKIDLSNVDDMGLWLEIFRNELNRRYIIRKNQGHKRKCEDERVYLLWLDGWKTPLETKARSEEEKSKPEAVAAIRSVLRAVDSPVVKCDQALFESYYNMAVILVQRHGLIKWCERTLGMSIDEYFDRLRNMVGTRKSEWLESVTKFID